MKKKTPILKLLLLFLIVFGIKTGFSLLMSGTFMYSDEACVIAKARHFIQFFQNESCGQITSAPAGDPWPFFPILISPIYGFLDGIMAYHGVLILNAFLVSSIVFPLYFILKRFLKKNSNILLIIITTVFLAHLTLYEKMLATESSFVVANIWFLYFYLESFYKHKVRNKIIAFIIGVIATFIRPFGFIVLLAMSINEIIVSKYRGRALKIYLPLSLLVTFISLISFSGGFIGMIIGRITPLINNPANFFKILEAIAYQYNSFLIGTLFVGTVVFLCYITDKQKGALAKIQFFILGYVILNFLIAANHIYGYLLTGKLDLLTRYINSSLVYVSLFALIFLAKNKKFVLSSKNLVILAFSIVTLFFIEYDNVKHSLNLVLSNFFETNTFDADNNAPSNDILAYYFLPFSFLLFALLLWSKNKILKYVLILSFVIHGALVSHWIIDFSEQQQNSRSYRYFKDEEAKILYINSYRQRRIHYDYWRLYALTENNLEVIYLNDARQRFQIPDFYGPEATTFFSDYDYIISSIPLEFEEIPFQEKYYVYKAPTLDDQE